MDVLVTGATGFVGSHTTRALLDAGHRVRVLVRAADRIPPAFGPLGIDPRDVQVVVGDVTDPATVGAALTGCASVIHAASVYSLDFRLASTIQRTNLEGTSLVLGEAVRRGLDPVVHISSVAAFMDQPGGTITPETPPGFPPTIYPRSKAESDRIARRLQDSGAPVCISYPGMVWGPHDPHWGESCQAAEAALRGFALFSIPGGLPISDVQDLAVLHARLVEPGRGPRRVMALNHFGRWTELVRMMARLTGRLLPVVQLPSAPVVQATRALQSLQRRLPWRLPATLCYQGVVGVAAGVHMDDSATRSAFAMEPRPLEQTVAGQLRWMATTGRIHPRLAGRLGV
jgi:nucleoside-diphosphate-sugar epimerase